MVNDGERAPTTTSDLVMVAAQGQLSVKWKTVAVFSSVVATAAIAALAFVAFTKGADPLASIALSLAILAFVLQIVVFLAQASSSTQLALQVQSINTETRTLLEVIRATTTSIDSSYQRQFDYLLKRVIPETLEEVQGRDETTFDPAAFSDQLTEKLTKRLGQMSILKESPVPQSQIPTSEDLSILQRLLTFPSGPAERRAGMTTLKTLSPAAVKMLRRYARREMTERLQGERGILVGSSGFDAERLELVNAGLIEELEASQRGRRFALLDAGIEIARFLVATEAPPANLAASIKGVRDGI